MFTLTKADGVACIPLDRAGMSADEVVMVRIF
jgi:hypothetical protein